MRRLSGLAIVAFLVYCPEPAHGQPLTSRRYGLADGLAHGQVNAIHQDSLGYLWFGTGEGVSRFDGYGFTTYGVRDGLGHPIVNAIAEDRRGRLWLATNGGGVARLREDASARSSLVLPFESFRLGKEPSSENNQVNDLVFDREGALWCATDGGVFRAANPDVPDFVLVEPYSSVPIGMSAYADRGGRLWFGMDRQIVARQGAAVARYDARDAVATTRIVGFAERSDGVVLAASHSGIYRFEPDATGSVTGRWQKVPLPIPTAPAGTIHSIVVDSMDTLWIGTTSGLMAFDSRTGAARDGLATSPLAPPIMPLLEDREGNLWGASAAGAHKLWRAAAVPLTRAQGLPDDDIQKTVEDPAGRIFAVGRSGRIVDLLGDRTERPLPHPVRGSGALVVCDRRGDWWFSTLTGVWLARAATPLQASLVVPVPAPAEGQPPAIYQDPRGSIWISGESRVLHRATPGERPSIERIPLSGNVEPRYGSMVADGSGTLWLGAFGALARVSNGQVERIYPAAGLPETLVRSLFVDSRGSLWVGLRYGGVSVTHNPGSSRPAFTNYSTRDGLQSDSIWAINEDGSGGIYLATGRGLDRLDPRTGQIRHFTAADGVLGGTPRHFQRDRTGRLWLATSLGIVRLDPVADSAGERPPPVYITRVQIAGETQPLPNRGSIAVPAPRLSASQNNLTIDYVGLTFTRERALRYQYMLEGADRDWTPPSGERSVTYGRLSPGAYRFAVRAVTDRGAVSQPASMAFVIPKPLWLQWWFLALACLTVSSAAFGVHRARVGRILALERLRRQVALDLHDDLGSGLAQIAILSEVARDEASPSNARVWSEVAGLARTMRESMSDIVWAVDPRKDRLVDLVQRFRQVAFNLLEADGLAVTFVAPSDAALERIGFGPDRRRHLLLIFKEAVTNISRHAGASNVHIEITIGSAGLRLSIQDDGCGFDPAARVDGHGLHSLRRRAAELDATLEIRSNLGTGTTILVTVPRARALQAA